MLTTHFAHCVQHFDGNILLTVYPTHTVASLASGFGYSDLKAGA